MRSALPVLVIMLLGFGCADGTSPTSELSYVSATSLCGPADGPDTGISFDRSAPDTANRRVDPVFPYLWIVVTQPLSTLVGSWSVDPRAVEANAVYAPNFNTRIDGVGSITITRVAADDTVVGRVNLFLGAQPFVREFSATWVPSTVVCN